MPSMHRHLSFDSQSSSVSSGVVTTDGSSRLEGMTIMSTQVHACMHARVSTPKSNIARAHMFLGRCFWLLFLCFACLVLSFIRYALQTEVVLPPGDTTLHLPVVVPFPGAFKVSRVSLSLGPMRFVGERCPPSTSGLLAPSTPRTPATGVGLGSPVSTPGGGSNNNKWGTPGTPVASPASASRYTPRRGGATTPLPWAQRGGNDGREEPDVLVVAQRRDPLLVFVRQPPVMPET